MIMPEFVDILLLLGFCEFKLVNVVAFALFTLALIANTLSIAFANGSVVLGRVEFDVNDAMLLEKNGIHYRLNKYNFTITKLHKHQQETGWCTSYAECLALAKAFS